MKSCISSYYFLFLFFLDFLLIFHYSRSSNPTCQLEFFDFIKTEMHTFEMIGENRIGLEAQVEVEVEVEDDEDDPEFAGMFGQKFLDALYGRLAVGMRQGAGSAGM